MVSAKVIKITAFALAGLAGAVAVVGAIAPDVAPDTMTMETMATQMDVERYQDEGTCDFWVTNMSNPTERIERNFDCSFYWDWSLRDEGSAYVHEVLYDRDKDQVFEVPNMDRGRMQEYYHVDGHMLTEDALGFTVDSDPEPGVLMPPPKARGEVTMGWVESGGEHGGEEKLVHARQLREVDTEQVQSLEVVHWNSSFTREETSWHGYDVYMTEHVDMRSDPQTAWVLEMRRHVKVAMTPSQMTAAAGQPIGLPGGEPQTVMELVYETKPPAIADHAEQAQFFRDLMLPIENGETLQDVGTAMAGLSAVVGLATHTVSSLLAGVKASAAA